MRLKTIKEHVQKKFSALSGRIRRQIRKAGSILLSVSMVIGSMPISAFISFAADDDKPDYVYEIESSSFVTAIKEAVAEDNSLDKELKFLGEAADEYDELFDPDGNLYELKNLASMSDARRDRDLAVRTFIRIDGDIPLDEGYVIYGDEEVLFLIANKSNEEKSVKIHVDEKETEVISVPSVDDIEVSEEDLESIKRDFMGGAGSPDGNAPGGNGSQRGSSNEKDEAGIVIEKPDRSGHPDGNDLKDSDVRIDDDKPGKDNRGDSKNKVGNPASDKKDSGDDKESSRADKEGQDTDKRNGCTDKDDNSSGKGDNHSENTGHGSDKEKTDPGKDNSGSDKRNNNSGKDSEKDNSSQSSKNDSGTENKERSRGGSSGSSESGSSEKAGEKSASVSVHNGNLLAASVASVSNAEKASSSNADTASPSDAHKLIEGILYDPVWFENKGAVAFVTTTKDIGLEDTNSVIYTASDGDVVVTVELPAGAVPAGAELIVTVHDEDSSEYADAIALIEDAAGDHITANSENDDDEESISTLLSQGDDAEAASSFTFSAGDEEDLESGWISLDISFYVDSEEVEPSDTATVTIDASEVPEISAGTIQSYEVWHLEETDDGIEPVLVAEINNSYDTADGVAEFTVESFSEFEFHYTCSESGWAGFGVNLIDENGDTLSATVSSNYTINNGRYTTTVDMPYKLSIKDFSEVFNTTNGTYIFQYATVTDPNYGDTEHTFDVWTGEEQVGANELYGSKENPVVSITIDGTAAADNPNYNTETVVSKTWHFTLTYADDTYVTIPIYGNQDGGNDNGGKYCPQYLEINLYYKEVPEAVLNLGNGNGTYSDGDYTGSYGSGGEALRYGTGDLIDYVDDEGNVTINLPSDDDLDKEFTVVDATGNEGEEGYQPAITIELGKEEAYDYKLIGWINIATGDYYDVSGGPATAVIDLSNDNVFYADWIAASYDHGHSTDEGLRDDTVSTSSSSSSFVTLHMFDYNELFDLYSVSLTQNGTAGESWTDSGRLYSEPPLGNTDLTSIGSSFIFQNNGTTTANQHVLSHANPARWNLWTDNGIWENYPEYNFVLDAKEYWNITRPDSTILGMLYDTEEKSLGVHYVGDGDYLFWIDDDGYYTYDSAKSGAAYNQSEGRFYVYEDSKNAFFPYNGHTDNRTTSNGYTNYWFGMNMEVNFYLPTATSAGSETDPVNQINGKDMTFDFSGDDDIMIFVDDKMAVDMSGIHSTSYSRINFSTNTVTYSMGLDSTGAPDTTGAGGKYFVDENLNLSAGYHTMQVFYMERGGSASNLKVQFNLVPTWDYETGAMKTFTADKVWQNNNGDVLSPAGIPDDLSAEIGLFDALNAKTTENFGYTKEGSTYTVEYEDDNGSKHTYVYTAASGSTGAALTYTEDDKTPVVYNKTDSEGRVLDSDGYVIAWLDGETLHIRIDKQTLSNKNGWDYSWEMLDPDGEYEVLELSDNYLVELDKEDLESHLYWSIIGDKEIEEIFDDEKEHRVDQESYPVILTDAAEQGEATDKEKPLGDTKEANGWVIYADQKDNSISSDMATFSQQATLEEDKTSTGEVTKYHGAYGVTSESEIDALIDSHGTGVIWYMEDSGEKENASSDLVDYQVEGFYLYCLLDGERYYLALEEDKSGSGTEYILVVTPDKNKRKIFYYDLLGELRVDTETVDESGETTDIAYNRVIIDAETGKVEVVQAEFIADKNDVRIYTLTETETAGNAYTAINRLSPYKSVDTDGDGVFNDNGKTVRVGEELVYQIDYWNSYEETNTITITDVLDKGLTFVSATDGGEYDSDNRTITWVIENVPANTYGHVQFTVKVNSNARNRSVTNTGKVKIGDHPAVDTNTVSNPGPRSSSGGGGGGSSGSSGGSGVGGPGDSGDSGDGDIWDLLPLPSTGQGWAMLFGAIALVVSAMALVVLLWYRRRQNRND